MDFLLFAGGEMGVKERITRGEGWKREYNRNQKHLVFHFSLRRLLPREGQKDRVHAPFDSGVEYAKTGGGIKERTEELKTPPPRFRHPSSTEKEKRKWKYRVLKIVKRFTVVTSDFLLY